MAEPSYSEQAQRLAQAEQAQAGLAAELAQAQAALARAEDNARAGATFLTMMTHQLRTPMSSIMGMAELLSHSTLTVAQQSMLRSLRDGADSLSLLINDLLDFNRLECGQLALEMAPLDPATLLDSVMAMMRPRANAKGLALWLDCPVRLPWLHGDIARLRQMVQTMLSQLIRCSASGTLRLTLGMTEHDDQACCWQVSVGGGDVSERQWALLAQTLDATPLADDGHGLDLAIAQRLARAMHGDICVQRSADGGGALQLRWLARRCAAPVAVAATEPPPLPDSITRLAVLVAEDNPLNQLLLMKMLERLGLIDIRLAVNGEQAVAMSCNGDIDLVLMDVQMPVLDGLEATRLIRQRATQRQPAIIAVSANSDDAQRQQCLAAGMNDFLGKPLKLDTLLTILWAVDAGRYLPGYLDDALLL